MAAEQHAGDITAHLAEWSTTFELHTLPDAGVELARRAFTDTLGVALAGSTLPSVKKLVATLAPPGRGGASLFGLGNKAHVLDAALVNGTSGHAQLFDDNNAPMLAHPSTPLVTALLALAQTRRLNGRAVVQAYAVGIEVGVKLGRLTNPTLYEAGWHATSVLGTMATAAACSRLMDLDARQCRMALGIAGSMAQGLRQNFGTMTMGLHAGLAARHGLHAAMLAEQGFESDDDALEGRYGFLRLFAGDTSDTLPGELGAPHELMTSGIQFKPYPSGAPTIPAVDAILAIRGQTGPVDASQVDALVCRVHPWIFKTLREGMPTTGLRGKVSLAYCVSRMLIDGTLGVTHFTDEAVRDASVVALMKRVQVEADDSLPDNGEFPAEVELRLDDGRTFVERREHPRGSPASPMSAGDIEGKFRDCATTVLPTADTDRALRLLAGLLDLDNVDSLCTALESQDTEVMSHT